MRFKFVLFVMLYLVSSTVFCADYGKIASYIRPLEKDQIDPKTVSVMVTLFKDGQPLAQKETTLSDYISFAKLKPGEYSLRFEGAGIQTLEKHGVLVFAKKTTELHSVLKKGTGTNTYHYSTSGSYLLNDKEMLNKKISRLEDQLDRLKKIRVAR